MKKNFTLMILGFCLFSLTLISCDQKEVGDISIAPAPPIGGTGGFSAGYYVSDLLGSDANNGLSPTTPYKTIGAAYTKVAAGDTVFVMNGTYSNVGTSSILNITKSGTVDKYITFKNYAGHSPKIYISGNLYNGVVINGNYIVFEGIEMQGDNANLTYANALASYNIAAGGGTDPNAGIYNTNGISIGGPSTQSKLPHHVVIRNCKVHDFSGGGISAIQADYITWEGNTVYNNAWYMIYGGSGMSILNPFNSDAADITKYKNIVRNNICYGNKTTIPWIQTKALSDGNGIIIDVNQYAYGNVAGSGTDYKGRTLVENNVSFNNGGSGIHTFRGDHCDIINNTAYGNGTVVGYANIFAGYCNDVKIINNIMYANAPGSNKCTTNGNNINVTYNYNIYFNGTTAGQGANDKVLNPQFVNASSDGTIANFSLNLGSPAIDAGTQTIFSAKDIKGVIRPKGITVDCGAYEVQ